MKSGHIFLWRWLQIESSIELCLQVKRFNVLSQKLQICNWVWVFKQNLQLLDGRIFQGNKLELFGKLNIKYLQAKLWMLTGSLFNTFCHFVMSFANNRTNYSRLFYKTDKIISCCFFELSWYYTFALWLCFYLASIKHIFRFYIIYYTVMFNLFIRCQFMYFLSLSVKWIFQNTSIANFAFIIFIYSLYFIHSLFFSKFQFQDLVYCEIGKVMICLRIWGFGAICSRTLKIYCQVFRLPMFRLSCILETTILVWRK